MRQITCLVQLSYFYEQLGVETDYLSLVINFKLDSFDTKQHENSKQAATSGIETKVLSRPLI
jgi:hypothetical protein